MKRRVYVYGDMEGPPPRLYPDGRSGIMEAEITEPLETLLKNGCRLVSGTDLPKPSEPEVPAVSPTFPNTLLGIRNYPTMKGIAHLGKAASQLPAAGYEVSSVYPNLLRHLASLAQAYDTLRQVLLNIPADTLRRADEAVAAKK